MMVKIVQFHNKYQKAIELLKEEISREFDKPISASGPPPTSRRLDKYWIATQNNQVVGTIAVCQLSGSNVILKNMFVRKEARGRGNGISELLLQTAIEWAKKENNQYVFLGTMTQFEAAHKFYTNNHFQKIYSSELPLDYFHNELDDIFYKLEL